MKTTILGIGLLATIALGCASKHQQAAAVKNADARPSTPTYPVIVQLVARNQTIIISAGPSGSLFSAKASDGAVLVSNASLEELRKNHPELYQQVHPATVAYAGME